jgi:prephenate dehydrogenase
MKEIGIIGFGQFGQFMARYLARWFDVAVCDVAERKDEAKKIGVKFADFEEAASKEIVIFSVPLKSFANVLVESSKHLRAGALVIDVCSVKLKPIELMLKHLPQTVEIIGTHPLFGPQSGREGIEGLKIALCPVRTTRADEVKSFLSDELKLKVLEKSPEEHDKEMARVQALTHFVARALFELHVEDSELATVSYEELMKAASLLAEDSWELFQTIQQGNPFADERRKTFIEKLNELEKRISASDE